MARLRPLLLIGTRPEAIKMAPIILECRRWSEQISPLICLTGQHHDMVAPVLGYFSITADRDLKLMRADQGLAELTSRCLTAIDGLLAELKPDCLVSQGDTTTVLCAAMAAFYRRVPFVHVEAGLRTGNIDSPWPEEMNRRVATLAARLHCAPTQRAADNLLREGVERNRVHVTGNTVIDALMITLTRERACSDRWRAKYPMASRGRMVLITAHRRESFGQGFIDICDAIAQLSRSLPDVQFVYPVHLNPNVQQPVREMLGNLANVHLLEPLPYPGFVWLMDRASVILTDSGGVQEEAITLRKPILIMRETTERPEGVELGAAKLVGADAARIVEAVQQALAVEPASTSSPDQPNPYGDGHAAERIVDLMLNAGWQHD